MALAIRSGNPVVRRDPFADFDQIVSSFFGGGYAPVRATNRQQTWRPLADVSETDSGYEVAIEVPGLRRDDITVDVDRDLLSVTGEYRSETDDGEQRHHLRSGRFEYRTQLPKGTTPDEISASLADGILTLFVPKAASPEPRRVEISVN